MQHHRTQNAPEALRDEDLETMVGGFNPQPDPPGVQANANPLSTHSFTSAMQIKGIIAI